MARIDPHDVRLQILDGSVESSIGPPIDKRSAYLAAGLTNVLVASPNRDIGMIVASPVTGSAPSRVTSVTWSPRCLHCSDIRRCAPPNRWLCTMTTLMTPPGSAEDHGATTSHPCTPARDPPASTPDRRGQGVVAHCAPSSGPAAGRPPSGRARLARALGAAGSTRRPVVPSSTISDSASTRVATTATPCCMASMATYDDASHRDGTTSAVAERRLSVASSRQPTKRTDRSR